MKSDYCLISSKIKTIILANIRLGAPPTKIYISHKVY